MPNSQRSITAQMGVRLSADGKHSFRPLRLFNIPVDFHAGRPIKTHYQYIHFQQVPSKGKTTRWYCRNTKSMSILGTVKWYSPWRAYCFFPMQDIVFSAGCLQDIILFIEQLMNARQAKD